MLACTGTCNDRTTERTGDRYRRHRRDHDWSDHGDGGASQGKACSVLDITGLAQKGGAVMSHVRLADNAAICIPPVSVPAWRIW
jgi:hypothetical protein